MNENEERVVDEKIFRNGTETIARIKRLEIQGNGGKYSNTFFFVINESKYPYMSYNFVLKWGVQDLYNQEQIIQVDEVFKDRIFEIVFYFAPQNVQNYEYELDFYPLFTPKPTKGITELCYYLLIVESLILVTNGFPMFKRALIPPSDFLHMFKDPLNPQITAELLEFHKSKKGDFQIEDKRNDFKELRTNSIIKPLEILFLEIKNKIKMRYRIFGLCYEVNGFKTSLVKPKECNISSFISFSEMAQLYCFMPQPSPVQHLSSYMHNRNRDSIPARQFRDPNRLVSIFFLDKDECPRYVGQAELRGFVLAQNQFWLIPYQDDSWLASTTTKDSNFDSYLLVERQKIMQMHQIIWIQVKENVYGNMHKFKPVFVPMDTLITSIDRKVLVNDEKKYNWEKLDVYLKEEFKRRNTKRVYSQQANEERFPISNFKIEFL